MKKTPRYALFSVFDKTGLVPFARELSKLGFQLIASGGTADVLKKARLNVLPVEKITGFPGMLGGRVKTLHPLIHGGILWRRDNPDDQKTVSKFKIPSIDIVVVNLYPFEAVASQPNATHEEIVENIDIGGPALIRSTAKNYESTAIVVNPGRFDSIIEALKENKGAIPLDMREALALEAFRHTERYDTLITRYFANRRDEGPFPTRLLLPMQKVADLRYGENPHQRAALYRNERKLVPRESTIVKAKQLHGKELSFNNYLDLNASWDIASSFAEPAAAIIKHNNPCGVAVAKKLSLAYKKAFDADRVSAFGGIVATNRPVDRDTARQIVQTFMECVIAPGYQAPALAILKKKKNLRLMAMSETARAARERISLRLGAYDYKKISGGFLVQEADTAELSVSDLRVVTKREPTLGELQDLFFAFTVAKYVKSNAIVIAKNGQTVGLGVGQTNRVGAVDIALRCARGKAQDAVMASDGFFPFGDSVAMARKAGIRAIIQPGGSIRDDESITEANRGNIAMVFTGRRHFRH